MKKNILITGASKGIGKSIALQLCKNNRLFLFARNQDKLQKIAQQIHDLGGEAYVFATDITNEEQVNRQIGLVLEKFSLDVLINNAGVGVFKAIEEISLNEWDWIMNVNVKGTFLMSKALVPHFKAKKSGLIITVESDVAKRTFANGSVYCASKYAQEAFTQVLRKELRPFGVRVSAIYPGITSSEFDGQPQNADYKQNWLQPEQIAQAIEHIVQTPDHVLIDEITIHPIWQEY